jgi:predicted MFS family arabinose efflux permease
LTITSPRAILAVMMAVNILNYVDRQIVYALLPLIQSDLRLTDTQAGSLASAFMIVIE